MASKSCQLILDFDLEQTKVEASSSRAYGEEVGARKGALDQQEGDDVNGHNNRLRG